MNILRNNKIFTLSSTSLMAEKKMANASRSTALNLFATLLLLTLTACGGGSGGSGGTTSPTVSSTSPASNATGIATDTTVTATFSEDIFAITVGGGSFTLSNSGNVTGTVTFNGVNNIATFTPTNDLAIHAPYTATLSTAITNLSGNALAANYTWSFTTADGTWGTAAPIKTDRGIGNVLSPQVAFDHNGNALAVWFQHDGTRKNIWANHFDGTNWGTAALIETDNAGDASSPQIAFDHNGNAIAVWHQQDGTRTNIMANRFDGTRWGTAALIETDNAGWAYSPKVAFDNNGNALAVWEQSDGIRFNIMANRFDGISWGTAALIETDNVRSATSPQVAFDNNGNALAVWSQSDGIRSNIMANRFDGTNWSTAALIKTGNAGGAYRPQVAFDNNGNALVVWVQSDGIRYNIMANRFDGTSWGTAALIETDNAGDAYKPKVAFDNNGNALAVWEQYDGTRRNIWANHFDGTNWGTAALIETDNVGSATSPQIAFDNNGNALAVWEQYDGIRSNIMANRFDGTNWSTAALIVSNNAGWAYVPQVAFDHKGNALAVWIQTDGTRYHLWANRFE